MTSRRWFLGLATILLTLPAAVTAQDFFRAVSPDVRSSADGWAPRRAGAPLAGLPGPAGSALDQAGYATVGDPWPPAAAGPCDPACTDGVFACGTTSVQYLAGGYFSGKPGPDVPSFEYVLASVRCGYMLTDPAESWKGRTNYEFLVDLSAAAVTSGGYGDYFAGPTFYLRHNWVEPGACLVPYLQFGAGIVYTDTYKDRTQAAIGQQLEFFLRGEVGLRCFVAPNLSLDIEGGMQHISNAWTSRRNLGVNAWGGQVGFTYYFPAGCP